jgi:hypothetical protein
MIVTPLYAGLLALLFFVLSLRVVAMRGTGISLGDGGNPAMLRRIRGHGNFAEYVPLILVMMGILELSHYSVYLLHAMGITLVIARLLHGYALSFTGKFKFGRFWGTLLTYIVMVTAGALCVFQGLRALAA